MSQLSKIRQIQNNIYFNDCIDKDRRQNFLFFLGNHNYLFEDVMNSGFLTNAEMNYIIEHFCEYDVDPRTFENEFKTILRESLPRYNFMKSIEIKDELFQLFDDKYTREIYTERINELSENGKTNTTRNEDDESNYKAANKDLPMASTGTTFDSIIDWSKGGSAINENKNIGSYNIKQEDIDELSRDENESGNTFETYVRDKHPVDTIDKVWNYLLKPKAIEYLTSELQYAFILIY